MAAGSTSASERRPYSGTTGRSTPAVCLFGVRSCVRDRCDGRELWGRRRRGSTGTPPSWERGDSPSSGRRASPSSRRRRRQLGVAAAPTVRGVSAGPDRTAVAHGTTVVLERRARVLDDGAVLLGGSPPRMLHLSPAAADRLVEGRLTVTDATSAALARRLLDAGIAHPVAEPPDAVPPPSDVTVVIPVKDRTDGLARLLAALEIDVRRVRRDRNPAQVDLARQGARPATGTCDGGGGGRGSTRGGSGAACAGPGPARDRRRRRVGRPGGGAGGRRARGRRRAAPPRPPRPGGRPQRRARRRRHPAGGVPRLRRRARARLARAAAGAPGRPGGRAGRTAHRRVAPGHGLAGPLRGRALVARPRPRPRAGRPALTRRLRPERGPARPPRSRRQGFDEDMHVAEDVDLVLRLHAAGWRLRYEPACPRRARPPHLAPGVVAAQGVLRHGRGPARAAAPGRGAADGAQPVGRAHQRAAPGAAPRRGGGGVGRRRVPPLHASSAASATPVRPRPG